MSDERKVLRAEVEAAVLAAVKTIGVDGVDKAAIYRTFEGRAPRATLYRMIDAPLKSGRAGVAITQEVRDAAQKRAVAFVDPAASAASDIVATIPVAVALRDLEHASGGPIDVMNKLRVCVEIAGDLIKHAQTDDGKVRNARLLLSASEHLRRCMTTAAQLQEAMLEVAHIERFHAAIYDVLREENPDLVERVLVRIRQLNRQWGIEG